MAIFPARRDDAYIQRKHTRTGSDALRDLRKGKSAHVFDDGLNLDFLESCVWRYGNFQGRVGKGQRALFDRFAWCSPARIGMRLQRGRPDLPLYWVEIKGKVENTTWVYHLVPRPRPAA